MRVAKIFAIALGLFGMCAGCGDDDGLPPLRDGGPDGAAAPDGAPRDGSGGMDAHATSDGGPRSDTGPIPDSGPAPDGSGADGGPVSMPCMATGACDPFDPGSCPGETCHPGTSGTECVPYSTAGAEGDACASGAECGPGLLCLSFGGSAGFTCHRMCPNGSIGFCAGGKACIGTIGTDTCIRICRPIPAPCDIFAQDCSDSTDTCTLASNPETGEPYTGCRPAGTQGAGDPCGGADGTCGHGLMCIRTDMVAACHQVCGPDGGTPTCSIAGESCSGFARTWMVPYCA